MKLTNKHGLPEVIVKAIGTSRKPVKGRLSASDLSGAPWARIMKERHWDEIERDAGDSLWMLLGTSIHYALEKGAPEGALSEHRMQIQYRGYTITGIADLFYEGIISDHKVTSVFSYLLGEKPEWEVQTNIYAWLLGLEGKEVKGLRIQAILRDWQQGKAKYDPSYPQIPFKTIEIAMWSKERAQAYVDEWIDAYEKEEGPCSDAQRWKRESTFAVMKKGLKRAGRVLSTRKEAEQWMKKNVDEGKGSIIERPGSYAKCEGYCDCAKFCEFKESVDELF